MFSLSYADYIEYTVTLCYMATQIHEFYFGVVKMIFYKWAQILLKHKKTKNVSVIFLVSGLTTGAIQELIMVSVAWNKYYTCRVFSWMGCYYPLLGFPSLKFTGSICAYYLWICTPERSEAFLEHHVQEPSKGSKPDQTIWNPPNQLLDHPVSCMLQIKSLFMMILQLLTEHFVSATVQPGL